MYTGCLAGIGNYEGIAAPIPAKRFIYAVLVGIGSMILYLYSSFKVIFALFFEVEKWPFLTKSSYSSQS